MRLSKKHGVNPSVGVCFWCGNDNGTVILFGSQPRGEKAPDRSVVNYDPCPTCALQFARGIALIECTEHPNDDDRKQPPIQKDHQATLYPTGSYLVIREEAATRLLEPGPMLDGVLAKRRAYMEVAAFQMLNPTQTGEETVASDLDNVTGEDDGT